jgi:hypothetical protein
MNETAVIWSLIVAGFLLNVWVLSLVLAVRRGRWPAPPTPIEHEAKWLGRPLPRWDGCLRTYRYCDGRTFAERELNRKTGGLRD